VLLQFGFPQIALNLNPAMSSHHLRAPAWGASTIRDSRRELLFQATYATSPVESLPGARQGPHIQKLLSWTSIARHRFIAATRVVAPGL
jgi:hypothetical protein